jgi:hypothetical protein
MISTATMVVSNRALGQLRWLRATGSPSLCCCNTVHPLIEPQSWEFPASSSGGVSQPLPDQPPCHVPPTHQELKPEDLKQLLRELKAAAAAAPKEQPDLQHAASSLKAATAVATGLPVSELLTLAQQAESSGNGEESKAGEGSRSSNGGGSKAATASGRA